MMEQFEQNTDFKIKHGNAEIITIQSTFFALTNEEKIKLLAELQKWNYEQVMKINETEIQKTKISRI